MKIIRNADVFAPEALGVVDVLIAGGLIESIGRGIEVSKSLLEDEFDAGGRALVPGLIDGHVHVTGGGGEAGARSRVPRRHIREFTSAGVTTVVGLLGTDDVTRSTEELLAAVRGLNEEGLTALCHTGGYHLPPVTLTGSVSRDIVNVDVIIGVGEIAISDHRSSQPTLAELLRLASEAYVAGMMAEKAGIVHFHVGDGAAGLEHIRAALGGSEIPARVFNPTHVNRRKRLFEEAIELGGKGCTIDVTSFPVAEDDDAWSAARAVELYWESDGATDRITVSSDGGGCLPEFDADGRMLRYDVGQSASLANTIGELLSGGHSLETALAPFTTNPAGLLHLPRKGRIRAGGDADLVVVENGFSIDSVMARGVWHVKHGEQLVAGVFQNGR